MHRLFKSPFSRHATQEHSTDDLPWSAEDYATRKRYLLLSDQDSAVLRRLGAHIDAGNGGLIDRFYEFLRAFPETQALLRDTLTLERLKRAQCRYFSQLLGGDYGPEYGHNRMQVGVSHHRVGLEPKWYLGAYAYYLRLLLPEIWHAAGGDWQQLLPGLEALIKVVFLDLGIALDAYRQADQRQLIAFKRFNERIVESVPLGLLVLDHQLRVVSCNSFFSMSCGLAVDRVVGRTLGGTLGVPNLEEHLRYVLESGRTCTGLPFTAACPHTGSPRALRITASRVLLPDEDDEHLEMEHLLVIVEDMSEEEQLVALARASERRFHAVFETASDGIVMMGQDGNVSYFNQAAEKMFGWRREEIIGHPATLLLPASCREAHSAGLQRYLETGRLKAGGNTRYLEGLRRDGSVFPIECTISVSTIGEEVVFTGVLRDISERRQREAEIEESRSHLQALLEAVPDLVYYLDRDGIVRFANRLPLGHTEQDVLGRSWRCLVSTAHHEAMQTAIESVLRSGEPANIEVAAPGSEGETRWYACRLGPERRGDAVGGVVIVARDVTDKKQAETQLAASARMASVGTLAAGVAHEINTPVQFVGDSVHFLREAVTDLVGLVGTYREALRALQEGADAALIAAQVAECEEAADLEYLAEQAPRAVERSLEGLGRVTAIVRAMKAFAHPQQEEMSPAQLNDALMTTLTVARNEYKYVADVETDLGDLPLVKCYLGEINQVFLNIIVNAAHAIGDVVKGTEQRGRISIRSRVEGETVVISIADTGGGIPEKVRDRIFDMFFTTKEVGRGTGQGLALARATMEKHHGSITFETEVGRGTTFFIRLPIEGACRNLSGQDNEQATHFVR